MTNEEIAWWNNPPSRMEVYQLTVLTRRSTVQLYAAVAQLLTPNNHASAIEALRTYSEGDDELRKMIEKFATFKGNNDAAGS